VTAYQREVLETFHVRELLRAGYELRIEGIAARDERAVQIAIYNEANRSTTRLVLLRQDMPTVAKGIDDALSKRIGLSGFLKKPTFMVELCVGVRSGEALLSFLRRDEAPGSEPRRPTFLNESAIQDLQTALRWASEVQS